MKNLQKFDASRFLFSQIDKAARTGFNTVKLRQNGPITVADFQQAAKANNLAIEVEGLLITLARNHG